MDFSTLFTKFDPTLLLMGLVLVVLVVFMVRNSRKRRRDAQEMQDRMKVGTQVMTNFGLYGKIKSIDEAENKIVLETSPGHSVTVHRQTVARVVEPTTAAPSMGESIGKDMTELAMDPEKEAGSLEIKPKYGERVPEKPAKPRRKPASDSSK